MAAHQAPSSLGFSRQEHWSGLPFPSPMHESEKWKWRHSVVSYSSRPHGLQHTRLPHPWIFQARVLERGAIAFSKICLLQTFIFFNIPLPPPQMILMCSCTLDDQNIFLICIFGLRPWFLAHSSPNSWNFLSKKSRRSIFCYTDQPLGLSSWNCFRPWRWFEFICNKPLSTTIGFMLVRWLLEDISGWKLVAKRTNLMIRVLEIPPLISLTSREGRGTGGWIHLQWPKI